MDESEQANQKAIALINGNLAQIELDAIFSNLPSFYRQVDPTLHPKLFQALTGMPIPKSDHNIFDDTLVEDIVLNVMDIDITDFE